VAANRDKYNMQSNPLQRYKLFFSMPGKLLKNPAYGLGMLVLKTMEFIAGGLGRLTRGYSHI
jgi:hypothetical protein